MTAHPTAETLRPFDTPVDALDALIARHGPLRIILALPAALLMRRRERLIPGYALSAHLQRDIGLTQVRTRHWEMR